MEKILGVPIGFQKVIPGTAAHLLRSKQEIVYLSDDGKGDLRSLFERLTKDVSPRQAKRGGMTSQGCRLWLPDGTLFHPIGYHGDFDGWRSDIESGARQLRLLTGRIEGDQIVISDGRRFDLKECRIEFNRLVDGKSD
jgi:hypothetical protein